MRVICTAHDEDNDGQPARVSETEVGCGLEFDISDPDDAAVDDPARVWDVKTVVKGKGRNRTEVVIVSRHKLAVCPDCGKSTFVTTAPQSEVGS